MAIVVTQIQTGLEQTKEEILELARKTAKLRPEEIKGAFIVKSSIDARKQDRIHLVSSVSFEVDGEEEPYLKRVPQSKQGKEIRIQKREPIQFQTGNRGLSHPPIVVGFGPAGMFAGLALARMGYAPIILERGGDADSRTRQVERFWKEGKLDTESNVQFGEGGAGTFSDGKLTTRIHDPRCSFVLEEMVRFGAPEEILHQQKPHVGTDLLREIVKNIRKEIIQLGGQVLFHTQLTGLDCRNGQVTAALTSRGEIPADVILLAVGHSARDTFQMLAENGTAIEPKAFSVGVRIEQRQEVIDRGLYGKYAGHPALPKGEYQLSWRNPEGRGVYTFCMCPGGFVVPSSSEPDTVVTNGMSEYARDGANANAALVVAVDSRDFGDGPLDGIAFQRMLEQKAFALGGGSYCAPAQSAASFLAQGKPELSSALTKPTYACGVREAALSQLFPEQINGMLCTGLRLFNNRLKGFGDKDAILTGVETRTSSPVRLTRNPDSLQAVKTAGLYPCGEGAGYAGGIVSAAVDGIRTAQKVMEEFAQPHAKG